MKSLRLAVATLLVAAFGLLMGLAPASAAIYGSVSLHLGDNHTCCGTGDVQIDLTSDPSGLVCATLTVSASDGALVYKGGSLAPSQTFTNVKTPFSVRIHVNPDNENWHATTHARCEYDDAQTITLGPLGDAWSHNGIAPVRGGVAQSTALVSAVQVVESSGVLDKTACPRNHGSDSDSDSDGHHKHHKHHKHHGLPNTGGERLLWLVIGLVLVVGGTTVVVSSRRREHGADS